LLRQSVDRIGLGGYLHLTEDFPDFQDCIERISDEFRTIKQLRREGAPYTEKGHVAVLHSWGTLRPWTLSGHFHETYTHDLIHVNEALSGMPVNVSYIDFRDVTDKPLDGYQVIINAGRANDAWSGGEGWSPDVIGKLSEWVYNGGTFIGINEPSARSGYSNYFGMVQVLGVDMDQGDYVCHGKVTPRLSEEKELKNEGISSDWFQCLSDEPHVREKEHLYLTSTKTKILALKNGNPVATWNRFGNGAGIYLSSFCYTPEQTRMLQSLVLKKGTVRTDNKNTDAVWFPKSHKLVVVNNAESAQETEVVCADKVIKFKLSPYGMAVHLLK
jgi:beta-D-galactosyl-(1->4)-L-rhamnose phosphorylase